MRLHVDEACMNRRGVGRKLVEKLMVRWCRAFVIIIAIIIIDFAAATIVTKRRRSCYYYCCCCRYIICMVQHVIGRIIEQHWHFSLFGPSAHTLTCRNPVRFARFHIIYRHNLVNGFLWADFMSFSSAISYTFIVWTELVYQIWAPTKEGGGDDGGGLMGDKKMETQKSRVIKKRCSVTRQEWEREGEKIERVCVCVLNEAEWLWSEITSILCDFMKMNFGPGRSNNSRIAIITNIDDYGETHTLTCAAMSPTESASFCLLTFLLISLIFNVRAS